jgi:hypothetical protein
MMANAEIAQPANMKGRLRPKRDLERSARTPMKDHKPLQVAHRQLGTLAAVIGRLVSGILTDQRLYNETAERTSDEYERHQGFR